MESSEAELLLRANQGLIGNALRVYMDVCSTNMSDLENKEKFQEADYYKDQREKANRFREDLVNLYARLDRREVS